MNKIGRAVKQTVFESIHNRKITLPDELVHAHKITTAIERMESRWPEIKLAPPDDSSPVFIFSAGWRSGSTLLQRLIISSQQIAIWGEPLGEAAVIPRLAATTAALYGGWPKDSFFDTDPSFESLSSKWIANLTPPIPALMNSYRAFLDEWLAQPAYKRYQVNRWGLKEVRLTIHHARWLKWLYPNAKFLFICRSPFNSYSSWRGHRWGGQWPNYYSWSPISFTRHWKLLTDGFIDGYKELGGRFIRFEDLVSGNFDLDDLARYLEINGLDPTVLNHRVASPDPSRYKVNWKRILTPPEKIAISIIGGKTLKYLNY